MKENFLALLNACLTCFQSFNKVYNVLEYNPILNNQLKHFTKLASSFPVECIDTTIILLESAVDVLNRESPLHMKLVKSFHEIDDKILKHLKNIVINFVNVSVQY